MVSNLTLTYLHSYPIIWIKQAMQNHFILFFCKITHHVHQSKITNSNLKVLNLNLNMFPL